MPVGDTQVDKGLCRREGEAGPAGPRDEGAKQARERSSSADPATQELAPGQAPHRGGSEIQAS